MGRKIGILLHHGLGDVIMARKLLINCFSYFSNDEIFLIVKSDVEKSFLEFLDFGGNHHVVVLEYSGSLLSKVKMLSRFVMLRYYHFDVLLACHSTSGFFGNIFSKLLGAKISIGPKNGIGYSFNVNDVTVHKEDYYLSFFEDYLNYLKIRTWKRKSINYVKTNRAGFPDRYKTIFKNDYIVISPGTSPFDKHKRWDSKKFSGLIELLLRSFNLNVILLGSKADYDVLHEVYKNYLYEDKVLMINDLSIKDAITLIDGSKLLIAACTSALHMGNLVDANMVSIYGPTNYSVTGPVSKKNRIVRKEYSCSPCFRASFTSGCGTPKCMTDIEVQEVYDACVLSIRNEPIPQYSELKSTNAKSYKK